MSLILLIKKKTFEFDLIRQTLWRHLIRLHAALN